MAVVVMPRSQIQYYGAGGGRGGEGRSGSLSGPAPHFAFGLPFAGWVALSDMIADSNPELGDTMRALAAVYQAALERSFADRFADLRRLLRDAGIPGWSADEAERALLSDSLPLPVSGLAEDAGQAYTELMETGTVLPTERESDGFLMSVMHYGGLAVLGAGADQVPLPASVPGRREDLPEAFRDYFLPDTRLRAVASMDLPALASRGEFSLWCRSPLRRWKGDNLVATEHTYIEREVEALTNPQFHDTDAPVTIQYRDDIVEWQPRAFTESIRVGVGNLYYAYRLTEPKRSRAARRLRKMLGSEAIRAVLIDAVNVGVAAGTSAAGPVGAPLAPVASTAARSLSDALLSRLEAALADTNMTPWIVTHTTLLTPQYPTGPLSMFVLASPTAPDAKLHRVRRDPYDQDQSEMDLGYDANVRALQHGRGMIGLSTPPSRPCPSDLWAQVAARNQPASWTEPSLDNEGFRVLVPHAEADKGVSYVSALRADVMAAP